MTLSGFTRTAALRRHVLGADLPCAVLENDTLKPEKALTRKTLNWPEGFELFHANYVQCGWSPSCCWLPCEQRPSAKRRQRHLCCPRKPHARPAPGQMRLMILTITNCPSRDVGREDEESSCCVSPCPPRRQQHSCIVASLLLSLTYVRIGHSMQLHNTLSTCKKHDHSLDSIGPRKQKT